MGVNHRSAAGTAAFEALGPVKMCSHRTFVAGRRAVRRYGYRRQVPKAYAAFYRNVNLGRPRSPSRAQLESAFLTAGATAVASVRTNGTVAFDAPDPAAARRVLEGVTAELGAVCGLAEPACVRLLATLKALPWETAFAGIDPGSAFEFTVSFSCSVEPPALELPLSSARGDAVVLWAEGDVKATMIYTNVLNRGPSGVRSPVDALLGELR